MTPDIQMFDVDQASDSDLVEYHELISKSALIDRPDRPVLTYDITVGRLRNPNIFIGLPVHMSARVQGRIVGYANITFPGAENDKLAVLEITVHPAHRRLGIGTALLRAALPLAAARGRSDLEGWNVVKDSSGDRWSITLGFEHVQSTILQVLHVADVPSAVLDSQPPAGYRTVAWMGAAPDELVASYAAARSAIVDAPLGESRYRHPSWTADRVRSAEADKREHRIEHWVVAAVHNATGAVAGFTELELHPHRTDTAFQCDTAVLAEHRGHGLGRHVKSLMLRWLRSEQPQVCDVMTTTSAENTHMIAVNTALGFVTTRVMVSVHHDIASLVSALSTPTAPG